MTIDRSYFDAKPGSPQWQMLRLLLAQDGSTTRLCEAAAGGPVELHVLQQRVTADVPSSVRRELDGERYLERVTCLAAHGAVMMDNLSFVLLDGAEPELEAGLHAGTAPIGHLLAAQWVRRAQLASPGDVGELAQRLWQVVGLPDADATRAYSIATPRGTRMLIAETFRAGMLVQPVMR